MKRVYTDYASMCLRFYFRHPDPVFRSRVQIENWRAAQAAVQDEEEHITELLAKLYQEANIADAIGQMSADGAVSANYLWKIVGDIEKRVAKERGLI